MSHNMRWGRSPRIESRETIAVRIGGGDSAGKTKIIAKNRQSGFWVIPATQKIQLYIRAQKL
ncbi:hypothetical protein IQ270_02655 [Microcoleus sp. LEGE 07076]|uniref:hypothetical protein n=1 Tax=Microcoleus sp. LEGE 07076 TaxID=915322 RepID=UPI00187EE854|nr:hypothetical protein [Microcoleus sp. LEGE 07076]MBE9183654.1 hypothetical protein [Microcoleus sp. LEGE 07076]